MTSKHAKHYDWDKYMPLVRDLSKTPSEVAKIVGCSRDTIYRLRKLMDLETYTKTDLPRFDYLAWLRAGFPRDIRQNENLSRYMQGSCDDLPSMRISRGHMGRE